MKRQPILIILLSFIILICLAVISYLMFSKKEICYIKLPEVYAEFDMKKELEADYITLANKRQFLLDSLKVQLDVLGKQIDPNKTNIDLHSHYQTQFQAYQKQVNVIQQSNQDINSQYTDQIWTQINQYTDEYRLEHKIDIILGADGNGAVMSGAKELDITNSLIEYINKKYSGK